MLFNPINMYVLDKKHEYIVNECKDLLNKLPNHEYSIRDMGIKIIKSGKSLRIIGLHSEDIDSWNNMRLEKLYVKLVMTLQKVYETEVMK